MQVFYPPNSVEFISSGDSYTTANSLLYTPTPTPEKVIFNGDTTICIWSDGTKTVVKRLSSDTYDNEKALALCIVKKHMTSSRFYKLFEKSTVINKQPNEEPKNRKKKVKK